MEQPGTAGTRQGPLPKPPQQRGLPLGAPAEASAATAQDPPQASLTWAFSAAAPAAAGVGAAERSETLYWAVRGLACYNRLLEQSLESTREAFANYREVVRTAIARQQEQRLHEEGSEPSASSPVGVPTPDEADRDTRQYSAGESPTYSPRAYIKYDRWLNGVWIPEEQMQERQARSSWLHANGLVDSAPPEDPRGSDRSQQPVEEEEQLEMGSAAGPTRTQDEITKQIAADRGYALSFQEWDGPRRVNRGGASRRKRRPSTTSTLDAEGASGGGPAGEAQLSKRQRARARKAVGPAQREAERQRLPKEEEEEDRKALQRRKEEEAKICEVTDAELSQVTDVEVTDAEVADAEGLARDPAAAAEGSCDRRGGFPPGDRMCPPIPASWQGAASSSRAARPTLKRTPRKGARGPTSRDPAAAAEGACDLATGGRVRSRRSS